MLETIVAKCCGKCKQTKSIDEFYKDKSKKDGLHTVCKVCIKIFQKEYAETEIGKEGHARASKRYSQTRKGRQTQKRYRKNNPDKRRARHVVSHAIECCRLPRPDTLPCHYCEAQAEQYHHWRGYAKEYWFDVIPVCVPCHKNHLWNRQRVDSKRLLTSAIDNALL